MGNGAFPKPVNTPNGVGGAIGKSAETGEVLVRHPKASQPGYDLDKFDRGKCAKVASLHGTNGWLVWYTEDKVTEVTR